MNSGLPSLGKKKQDENTKLTDVIIGERDLSLPASRWRKKKVTAVKPSDVFGAPLNTVTQHDDVCRPMPPGPNALLVKPSDFTEQDRQRIESS